MYKSSSLQSGHVEKMFEAVKSERKEQHWSQHYGHFDNNDDKMEEIDDDFSSTRHCRGNDG